MYTHRTVLLFAAQAKSGRSTPSGRVVPLEHRDFSFDDYVYTYKYICLYTYIHTHRTVLLFAAQAKSGRSTPSGRVVPLEHREFPFDDYVYTYKYIFLYTYIHTHTELLYCLLHRLRAAGIFPLAAWCHSKIASFPSTTPRPPWVASCCGLIGLCWAALTLCANSAWL